MLDHALDYRAELSYDYRFHLGKSAQGFWSSALDEELLNLFFTLLSKGSVVAREQVVIGLSSISIRSNYLIHASGGIYIPCFSSG